ncbi:protein pigeon [Nilaparvata lugens]|uniref:protein pigeon n=1 Tax=Nilaparvata lugens TaxID=108931 RepID=UPI00193D31A9|nr:protein pigeon [Nilaparvata lugens]
MAQFLYWRKKSPDKFLVLAHQEAIQIYQVEGSDDESEQRAVDVRVSGAVETIVGAFAWGQWDPIHQALYLIHYRKPMHRVEGETQPDETELAPTLSALQFHEDMPHETVLNIPLNLPGMEGEKGEAAAAAECRTYENDAVPLRVHDCSLDVTVVSDSKGILCICHHYLYQPVKPPTSEVMDESNTVHFAYSVTLLHHGHVIHCNIPGIPFSQASTLRPTFTMYNDQHLLVYCADVFIHMLDVGQKHEPCCHILLGSHFEEAAAEVSSRLVTLWHPHLDSDQLLLNLTSLDVIKLKVTHRQLVDAYKLVDAPIENKLAILHYFLIHAAEPDIVAQLLEPMAEQSMDLDITSVMQEVLVGGAFATVMRSLPSDAHALINLLPFTTVNAATPVEVKLGCKHVMSLTQEDLWNPSVMLLMPRQRLMPYRPDMWTALWDALSAKKEPRFRSATVAEKLMVSLVCYQPEALSRCSTPLSPGGALIGGSAGSLTDMAMITGGWGGGGGGRSKGAASADPLPFYEVESSAASKQEHVISVNLREVSMHLLKRGGVAGMDSGMQVHAVATRYAAAQLEASHHLCQLVTRSAAIDTKHVERGFPLVNALEEGKRVILFSVMERYNLAIESLAFPLPQGFPSFMAYLGYRTLPFAVFLQYVQASVLQLQVDVMKAIIADLSDTGEGLRRKLRLLQLLPRSRAKRLLNQWTHPASLMLRAREHTLNILAGVEGAHPPRPAPPRQHTRLRNRGNSFFLHLWGVH